MTGRGRTRRLGKHRRAIEAEAITIRETLTRPATVTRRHEPCHFCGSVLGEPTMDGGCTRCSCAPVDL